MGPWLVRESCSCAHAKHLHNLNQTRCLVFQALDCCRTLFDQRPFCCAIWSILVTNRLSALTLSALLQIRPLISLA